MIALPDWRDARSAIEVGTTGCLGVGSPGAAQENRKLHADTQNANAMAAVDRRVITALENIPAEVLILYNLGQLLGDVGPVHFHVLFLQFRRLK